MVWHELVASPGGGIDPEREQERRLAAQARAGAEWALTALIARYQPAVVRYLVRLTGSTPRGQTLAQQVFVRMGKRLRGPHGGDHLRLWLLRAATEIGLEVLRHPTRGTPARLAAPEEPVALLAGRSGGNPVLRLMTGWGGRKRGAAAQRGAPAPEFVWQNPAESGPDTRDTSLQTTDADDDHVSPQEAIRHRMVRAVLAELPYGDAQCLALHLVAGLNQSEVAQALGVPPAVARRRIVQGLQLFGRRYDAALASLGLPPDFDLTAQHAAPAPEQPSFDPARAMGTVVAGSAQSSGLTDAEAPAGDSHVEAAGAALLPLSETLAELAQDTPGVSMPSSMPDAGDGPYSRWVSEDMSTIWADLSTPREPAELITGEVVEAGQSVAPAVADTVADDYQPAADEMVVDDYQPAADEAVADGPTPVAAEPETEHSAAAALDQLEVDSAPATPVVEHAPDAELDSLASQVLATKPDLEAMEAAASVVAPAQEAEPAAYVCDGDPQGSTDASPLAHADASPATDIPDWDALLAFSPGEGGPFRDPGSEAVFHEPEVPASSASDAHQPAADAPAYLAVAPAVKTVGAPVRVVPVLSSEHTDLGSTEAASVTAPIPARDQRAPEFPEPAAMSEVAATPTGHTAVDDRVVGGPRVVPVLPRASASDIAAEQIPALAAEEPWESAGYHSDRGEQVAPHVALLTLADPEMADDTANVNAASIGQYTLHSQGQQSVDDDEYLLVVDAEPRDPTEQPTTVTRVASLEPAAPEGSAHPNWKVVEERRRRVLSADGEAEDPDNFPL